MTWRGEVPPPRGAAGFTLIETIAVLVILGLVAALVVGRGPMHSPAADVRGAALRVVQGLRLARAQAIAVDRVQSFTVRDDPPSFQVGTRPPQGLPRGVTLAARVNGAPAPRLLFAPDGSGSGGAVEVAEGAQHVTVQVNWLSGRIELAARGP